MLACTLLAVLRRLLACRKIQLLLEPLPTEPLLWSYWDRPHLVLQVGVIDTELVRNLAICGGVILIVIFALVPNPRIAVWAPRF